MICYEAMWLNNLPKQPNGIVARPGIRTRDTELEFQVR